MPPFKVSLTVRGDATFTETLLSEVTLGFLWGDVFLEGVTDGVFLLPAAFCCLAMWLLLSLLTTLAADLSGMYGCTFRTAWTCLLVVVTWAVARVGVTVTVAGAVAGGGVYRLSLGDGRVKPFPRRERNSILSWVSAILAIYKSFCAKKTAMNKSDWGVKKENYTNLGVHQTGIHPDGTPVRNF